MPARLSTKPPKFDPDVTYLTAEDLARRWNVHVITVHKWRANGVLPPGELIGRNSRRWRSDEIAVFEWARREALPKR